MFDVCVCGGGGGGIIENGGGLIRRGLNRGIKYGRYSTVGRYLFRIYIAF